MEKLAYQAALTPQEFAVLKLFISQTDRALSLLENKGPRSTPGRDFPSSINYVHTHTLMLQSPRETCDGLKEQITGLWLKYSRLCNQKA